MTRRTLAPLLRTHGFGPLDLLDRPSNGTAVVAEESFVKAEWWWVESAPGADGV